MATGWPKIRLLDPRTLETATGKTYQYGSRLDVGSFGRVYPIGTDKIAKFVRVPESPADAAALSAAILAEAAIQRELTERAPGVCPRLYDYGRTVDANGVSWYVIIMERCVATAHELFKTTLTLEADILDYYEQIATILRRLDAYRFNHRDLKANNVMYKIDPTTNKKQFLLIDFGFACATFDGTSYAGTLYFKPEAKCFRRSRDLASLVFDTTRYIPKDLPLLKFTQLVLTFPYKGIQCDMTKGCPGFNGQSLSTYDFLDRDDVENPNTTPEGLLNAVKIYREGGLEAYKNRSTVDPMPGEIRSPPSPTAAASAVSPRPSLGLPFPKVTSPVNRVGGRRSGLRTRRRRSTRSGQRSRSRKYHRRSAP